MGSELPEGFTLDEPNKPIEQSTGALPEGFSVDKTPIIDTQVAEDKLPDVGVDNIIKKYQNGEYYGVQLDAAHELIKRGSLKIPDSQFGEQMSVGRISQSQTDPSIMLPSHETPVKSPSFNNPVVQFGIGAMEAMKNYPEDAYKVFKDTMFALSPIPKRESIMDDEYTIPLADTAIAGANVIAGLTEKLIPGEQDEEVMFDAVIDELINKYGSKADIIQTIRSRPADFTADLSSVLTGGGALVKSAGKVSGVGKLAAAGSDVTKIGTMIEPFNVIKKAVSEPIRVVQKGIPAIKSLPVDWYKSAAKFPTAKHITEAHRNKWAKTALYNEIMPTHEGLINLGGKISEINTEISGLIDAATKTGKTIPLDDIFKGLDELKLKAGTSGGTRPTTMIRQIENVRKQLTEANTLLKKGEIGPAYKTKFTPKEAQNIKTSIYRELEAFYTKSKNEAGRVVAGKKIAKNTKEFLQDAIPEIKELNQRDGDLIDLYDNLTRPSTRIGNLNVIPMDLAIKAGTGAAAGGPIGTTMGVIAGIFDMPKTKAKLAIVLNKLERQGVTLSPESTAFRDLIYESGKASEIKIEEKD